MQPGTILFLYRPMEKKTGYYHANSNPGDGCGNKRSPRAQMFTWNADGTPNFGGPVKEGVVLAVPSEK
jgi:GH43 family beta-xylosidase